MSDAMIGDDEIINRFGYHRATEESAPKHARVREIMADTGRKLDRLLPPGRDKSLAFTHLQEAMHWSNSAIAMQNPVDTENADKPNLSNA